MAAGTGVDSTMVQLVSTINSMTQKDIEGVFYDQVLKHNPVLYRCYKRGVKKDGGAALTWPIIKQEKVFGGSYAGSDTLAHGQEDTGAPAEVPWRHYYEDVTVARTDLLKAKGAYAKVNLWKFKVDEAILNLRQKISRDLYRQYTGAKALDNIFMAVDDGNGGNSNYAGIAHSNAYWKPGYSGSTAGLVNMASAPVTSLAQFESLYSEASDGDIQPSLLVQTPACEQFLWGQLQALQRFTRDEEMTKAGFEAFKFNRAVCVTDRNIVAAFTALTASTGGFVLLNEDYFDLVSHEDEDFGIDELLPGTPSERSLNTKVVWTGNLRFLSIRPHARLYGATNL